jgi:hypothetical protein
MKTSNGTRTSVDSASFLHVWGGPRAALALLVSVTTLSFDVVTPIDPVFV